MGMLGDHTVVNGGLCYSLAQYAVTIATSFALGSGHAGLERKIIRRRGDDLDQ